jgi:hypothetical protein
MSSDEMISTKMTKIEEHEGPGNKEYNLNDEDLDEYSDEENDYEDFGTEVQFKFVKLNGIPINPVTAVIVLLTKIYQARTDEIRRVSLFEPAPNWKFCENLLEQEDEGNTERITSDGLSMRWKHSRFIHFYNPEIYDIFTNEDLLPENNEQMFSCESKKKNNNDRTQDKSINQRWTDSAMK